MKTLLIFRHAKSSRDNPHWADVDRPLNDRGEKDAPRMGELIKKKRLVPDLIMSSPALRARRTTEKAAHAAGYTGPIDWRESFYGAGPADYINGIRLAPESCQRLMIVGHNPGMENLLVNLTGRDERLPTAAIACLGLPIDRWADISLQTSAQLQHLWKPKEI